jgi:hypothetical protein
MSGRSRDVEVQVRQRETAKGRRLTNRERAVAAMQTRMPKAREASLEQTVAAWVAHAADFDFGPAAVDALRRGDGFSANADKRRAAVSAAARARLRSNGSTRSIGESRSAVFECAAGALRLDEASEVLEELAELLEPAPASEDEPGGSKQARR